MSLEEKILLDLLENKIPELCELVDFEACSYDHLIYLLEQNNLIEKAFSSDKLFNAFNDIMKSECIIHELLDEMINETSLLGKILRQQKELGLKIEKAKAKLEQDEFEKRVEKALENQIY